VKRFPIGLTLAAAIGLAVLLGLGVWQLKRLGWKQDLLARIATLQHAAPRPLGEVLSDAAKGTDVGFVRVTANCGAPRPGPMIFRYALRDGQVGWRLLSLCPLGEGPYDGILLDRGLVTRFAGMMAPLAARFPVPKLVTGVLRAPAKAGMETTSPSYKPDQLVVLQGLDTGDMPEVAFAAGVRHPAPYYLAVESEAPAPPGVTPAALPQDIPNNHFVYALTWFGLAGVLVWTWASYVWRRMRAP
jgi:surfeit locus 1 family protein